MAPRRPGAPPIVTRITQRLDVHLEAYDRKIVVFARVEAGLIRMRHQLGERSAGAVSANS